MITKLYYVRTDDYDCVVAANEEICRVLTDDKYPLMTDVAPLDFLKNVEDISSWSEINFSIVDFICCSDIQLLAELTVDYL